MGIRRLLDLSQWNDSYSAVQIALALQWGMNDLPMSTVLSYFEQKAVVELLTLLSRHAHDLQVLVILNQYIISKSVATWDHP
ncbi:hypothetical protein DYB38_011632 [Aphanomyces astaci]|uniref:Uncharacterized protein n=1 Tax=Aphanomyces astaci TaxID=112090 RepID=A0A397D357_APHAT|nr:hypothetical protein DYB38_011632 [Aphanomyces astaci]